MQEIYNGSDIRYVIVSAHCVGLEAVLETSTGTIFPAFQKELLHVLGTHPAFLFHQIILACWFIVKEKCFWFDFGIKFQNAVHSNSQV